MSSGLELFPDTFLSALGHLIETPKAGNLHILPKDIWKVMGCTCMLGMCVQKTADGFSQVTHFFSLNTLLSFFSLINTHGTSRYTLAVMQHTVCVNPNIFTALLPTVAGY